MRNDIDHSKTNSHVAFTCTVGGSPQFRKDVVVPAHCRPSTGKVIADPPGTIDTGLNPNGPAHKRLFGPRGRR